MRALIFIRPRTCVNFSSRGLCGSTRKEFMAKFSQICPLCHGKGCRKSRTGVHQHPVVLGRDQEIVRGEPPLDGRAARAFQLCLGIHAKPVRSPAPLSHRDQDRADRLEVNSLGGAGVARRDRSGRSQERRWWSPPWRLAWPLENVKSREHSLPNHPRRFVSGSSSGWSVTASSQANTCSC